MRTSRVSAAVMLAAILTLSCGCGKTQAPPQASEGKAETAAASDDDAQELNQAIQQPMDKARALEGQLQKDAEETGEAIDEQSD